MKLNPRKRFNELKILLFAGLVILIGQRIGLGLSIAEAVPGMVMIIVFSLISLFLKDNTPFRFPAFAWAALLGLVLTIPQLPTSEVVLEYTDQVDFLATTPIILAVAGIAVGNKVDEFKEIGWKVVLVAIFVFLGTFIGSAIIAHILLTLMGVI